MGPREVVAALVAVPGVVAVANSEFRFLATGRVVGGGVSVNVGRWLSLCSSPEGMMVFLFDFPTDGANC